MVQLIGVVEENVSDQFDRGFPADVSLAHVLHQDLCVSIACQQAGGCSRSSDQDA